MSGFSDCNDGQVQDVRYQEVTNLLNSKELFK